MSQCSAKGQTVLMEMGREHVLGASCPAVLPEEHDMGYGSVYYQGEKSDGSTVTSGIRADKDILLPSLVIIKLSWCYNQERLKHCLPCHTWSPYGPMAILSKLRRSCFLFSLPAMKIIKAIF